MKHEILFFADRLPPTIGGMEIHAQYFIENFSNHPHFYIVGIITKNEYGMDCVLHGKTKEPIDLKKLPQIFKAKFIFFNSGCWIEELKIIKQLFPNATFIYRTGGNEIIKAPLSKNRIMKHELRQRFWVDTINSSIDCIITNSRYTEARLNDLGITSKYKLCVGGVNCEQLKMPYFGVNKVFTIVCAARFVPYKNHSVLLCAIVELIAQGYKLELRLIGDGPLLPVIAEMILQYKLEESVKLLGVLDNIATCNEIAKAELYMQLSSDHITNVDGGSYIHAEGMGRAILEAITAGVFVIVGNSGALTEIITPTRGMIVDINDTNNLVATLKKIINSFSKRYSFTEEYSWKNIFAKYEQLFMEYV